MAEHDIWRGSFIATNLGAPNVMAFWFKQETPLLDPGSDHDSLFDQLDGIGDDLVLMHSSFYVLQEIQAQKIWSHDSSAIEPGPIFSRARNDAGTRDLSGDNLLARWLAGYTSIHTNRGGRSGHGRYFWSNLKESDVNEDLLSTATGSAYDLQENLRGDLVNQFVGTERTSDWELGVFSGHRARVDPDATTDDVWSAATTLNAHTVLTSCKSRR